MASTPAFPDPRTDADKYLADKKVMELFHDLGQKLTYAKPSDPNEFLAKTLTDLQSKGGEQSFFTEKDIATMFSMFDPTGSGSITTAQYYNALKSFGVDAPTVAVEGDKVTKEAFMKAAGEEVAKLTTV